MIVLGPSWGHLETIFEQVVSFFRNQQNETFFSLALFGMSPKICSALSPGLGQSVQSVSPVSQSSQSSQSVQSVSPVSQSSQSVQSVSPVSQSSQLLSFASVWEAGKCEKGR